MSSILPGKYSGGSAQATDTDVFVKVARKGHIKEALDLLAGVHHETLRALKSYNFWIACTGILKARKQLYWYAQHRSLLTEHANVDTVAT